MARCMKTSGVLSILWMMAAASGCTGGLESPARADVAETGTADAALDGPSCTWSQWGQSAAHDGETCVTGQAPTHVLEHIVYDPFEFQEMSETGGDLFIPSQVPLNDGAGNFFMMHKAGTFTPCDPPGSGQPEGCGNDPRNLANEIWQEKRYQRQHVGALPGEWTFASG